MTVLRRAEPDSNIPSQQRKRTFVNSCFRWSVHYSIVSALLGWTSKGVVAYFDKEICKSPCCIFFYEILNIFTVRKRRCGKVMFLHLSVILFTGGVCHTPLGRHHPPYAVHAGRYGQQGGGTHSTGMHSFFLLFRICCMLSQLK